MYRGVVLAVSLLSSLLSLESAEALVLCANKALGSVVVVRDVCSLNEVTLNTVEAVETSGADEIVQGSKSTTIEVNNSLVVGSNQSEAIGIDRSIAVGNNSSENIGNNNSLAVGANHTETIGVDRTVTVGRNNTENVGNDQTIDIGSNLVATIGKNNTVTIQGAETRTVSKSFNMNAKSITLNGADQIMLRSGRASIMLKKNGDVTIIGGKISIKGSGTVSLKGSKVSQN